MKLTILGSGSYVSNADRNTSGYLLEENNEKIIVDLGIGCVKALQKTCNLDEINKLFFTHLHPDHVSGLHEFLFLKRGLIDNKLSKNQTQVTLFGPKGFKNFFLGLKQVFPHAFKLSIPINVIELEYSETRTNNFFVKTKPVKHENAIGYRFEANEKVLAYSGDSGYCEELVELCKNSALSVLECTLPDKMQKEDHLTPMLAAKIAKKANTEKLVLTHLTPIVEREPIKEIVSKIFKGKIFLAEDLQELIV